jgi:glycerophosphoryl diester phosphodiesterase
MMLIYAHRGASARAPENTLAAFRLAREFRADGVELDVALTADGVPVLLHDDTVDRTTDGSGMLSALTLEEVKRLDAGQWKGPEYSGERIPTLDEALAELQGMIVNIEIKPAADVEPVARLVVDLVRKHGIASTAIISSFAWEAIEAVGRLEPSIKTAFIFGRARPELPPGDFRPVFLHPHYSLVDREYVEQTTRDGFRMNVWTINDEQEALRLIDLGVEGLVSDVPDLLRKLVDGADRA